MGDKTIESWGAEHEHRVKVSSFYMGKYPVTQRLYRFITGENPSSFTGDDRPVETVSWNDTQEFIKQLNSSEMARKFLQSLDPAAADFRLPTEAEWEYAARGGGKSQGFAYSGSDKLKEVGWYRENSYDETKPVGLKFPNELGLFDMSGNVWEWCRDWYGEDYYKQCAEKGVVVDPPGPDGGVSRVLRGGSYFDDPEDCRSAHRFNRHPGNRNDDFGFRLVVPCQSVG